MKTAHSLLGVSLFLLLYIVPSIIWAGETVVMFDPEKTSIRFELGATMHKVRGTARLEKGEKSGRVR